MPENHSLGIVNKFLVDFHGEGVEDGVMKKGLKDVKVNNLYMF